MTDLPEKLAGHWETPDGAKMAAEYAGMKRDALSFGQYSDMMAATEISMLMRNSPVFEPTLAMAKDRIRWLSVQLFLAQNQLAIFNPPTTIELETIAKTIANWVKGARELGVPAMMTTGTSNIPIDVLERWVMAIRIPVERFTRLPDEKLAGMFSEELQGLVGQSFKPVVEMPEMCEQAALQAMRRVARYSDHLRGVMKMLADNIDLESLVYNARDQEQLGWDGPKVKAVGLAVAEVLAEVKADGGDQPRAGIDAKNNCSSLKGLAAAEAERLCDQPYTFDDGVPYCDTCGLFRASCAAGQHR